MGKRKVKKLKPRGIVGVNLWSVSMYDLNVTLWITGRFDGIAAKVKRAMKRDHSDIEKPRIYRIKSCGTIDA